MCWEHLWNMYLINLDCVLTLLKWLNMPGKYLTCTNMLETYQDILERQNKSEACPDKLWKYFDKSQHLWNKSWQLCTMVSYFWGMYEKMCQHIRNKFGYVCNMFYTYMDISETCLDMFLYMYGACPNMSGHAPNMIRTWSEYGSNMVWNMVRMCPNMSE